MLSGKVGQGTLIIGFSLILSRILGILRDILLAKWVGVGMAKNAYDLAFLIPDIINHLISTGYLSITFIPIFTGYLVSREDEKAWKFFSNVLLSLGSILVLLLVLGWIFTEPLLKMLTETPPDSETLQLAVKYSRIVLPAQLFFFAGAIFTAIQHVKMNFFLPAMTGLVYNAAIILGGYLGRESGIDGFVWGVLGGAFAGSFLLQIWGGRRSGARFRFYMAPFHPEIMRYLYITLPLILGVGAVFSLEFVYRSFGAAFGEAGIAKLGYAYRVMFSIVAVFGFAVGVASYPVLASLAKNQDFKSINEILFRTLAQILALLVPTVLIVGFCAEPIVQLLFMRGAFTREITWEVAGLLKYYLLSAFAMSSQILVVRCFYAREKTWLPAIVNTAIFAFFLPLYSWFAPRWGIHSIPILGGVCVTLQVLVLLWLWLRQAGWFHFKAFVGEVAKISLAGLLGAFILSLIVSRLQATAEFSPIGLAVYLGVFSLGVYGLLFMLQALFRVRASKGLLLKLLQKAHILHP